MIEASGFPRTEQKQEAIDQGYIYVKLALNTTNKRVSNEHTESISRPNVTMGCIQHHRNVVDVFRDVFSFITI